MFWLIVISRSCTGAVHGRSISASSATSRCTVPRMVRSRTIERSSSAGGDVVGVERREPGGQGEVRRQVLLSLQPDQVPHHLVRRRVGALEQVLPVQQGAVEPTGGEPHAAIIGQ